MVAMPRLAANLSFLYADLPFLDRFAAAAGDGFDAVEYLFPYAYPPQVLAQRLADCALQQVLINAPPGDWDGGERGLASLPGREAEFRAGILQALAYCTALDCPRLHVLAGLLQPGLGVGVQQALLVERLRWAAPLAAQQGVTLLIEPINQRDMPGYFLSRQAHAHALVQAVAAPNVRVQMDLYHCQTTEGDAAALLRHYLPTGRIGHLQVASLPGRHEPDAGAPDYAQLFAWLDAAGYGDWVGCEYHPRRGSVAGGTSAGLGWARQWLRPPSAMA